MDELSRDSRMTMLTGTSDYHYPTQRGERDANAAQTPSRQAMWFLSGRLQPNESVRHIPIHTSPFLVGRMSNVALSLQSTAVSSLHAELTDDGTSLFLRDLGSTNGTYVNAQRITAPVQLKPDDLVQFATIPFRVMRQSTSSNTSTVCEDVFDQALALVQFDKLMQDEAVVPHYQPIVELENGQCIGYEVLARSRIAGLEFPAAMFSAAAKLNLETKLSQMIRWKGIQQTMALEQPPHLFVNTHPVELEEPGLVETMRAVRQLNANQPITLEIHEAAISNPQAMKELRTTLRDLDIGLAFDDFGAGQTRLAELSEVHPDYLKFDMSLIRAIHLASSERVQMVATLVRMVREMGVVALAEGIENEQECIACRNLGFQLAQGYYLGRPTALRAANVG